MARNPKVINNAENHLIVQSLEVIKDVKGGGIQTIKAKVDSLGNAMSSVSQKQEAFWKNISSDKLITAVEKKQLKKEWETINRTYNAIYEKALSLGFENEEEIRNYKENFYILKDYLFTSLKVFDNMESNTNIPNKDYFNQLYADYYASEFLAQNRIFVGQMADTERLRVLSSLSVPGMDGEIALYKGAFYQYSFTKKEWALIDTAAIYKGPLANFPDDVDSSFFLAITTFDYRAYLLDSSGKKIKVNDGYLVATLGEIEEGYIYAHIGGRWQKIENRNDWRYVVALNDLIHYGFEIPENINGYVAGRINDFWSGVSSDNVITSIEKKSLHKEWENLKNNYESVKTKVAGLKDSVYYNNFVTAYTELDTYLNTVLKVFADLSADTEIPNRDIFNSKFATYYTNLTMIEFVYGETFTNSKFDKLETEIANKRDPKYLGAVSDIKVISSPKKGDKYITATSIFEYSGLVWIETNFVSGDWFMWGGSNSYATFAGLEMKNGYLYKKMSETEWTELQPNTTDSNGNLIYSSEFMSALTDILNSKNAGLGYFSSVFANALFANAAFIGALQTNNITLQAKNDRQTTYIQSSNYEEGSTGFRISSDGNADFNNITANNITATGFFQGHEISIKNLRPGDITLRRLADIEIPSSGKKTVLTQICGEGYIRIKFRCTWEVLSLGGYTHIFVISDGVETEVLNIKYGDGQGEKYLSLDIKQREGAYVGIKVDHTPLPLGTIRGTIDNIQICTDSNNGVLAYLGNTNTTETEGVNPR